MAMPASLVGGFKLSIVDRIVPKIVEGRLGLSGFRDEAGESLCGSEVSILTQAKDKLLVPPVAKLVIEVLLPVQSGGAVLRQMVVHLAHVDLVRVDTIKVFSDVIVDYPILNPPSGAFMYFAGGRS